MAVLEFVVGVAMLAIGTFMIARRESLPIRKAAASRSASAPPTLWVYPGTMFVALGLLELLLALV